jgi:hypothetical protein
MQHPQKELSLETTNRYQQQRRARSVHEKTSDGERNLAWIIWEEETPEWRETSGRKNIRAREATGISPPKPQERKSEVVCGQGNPSRRPPTLIY